MLLLNAYQNAYVTRNRDKAVAMLRERHGLEEFIFFEPDIEVRTPQGVGQSKTRVALGWAGNLQLEVIEPVSGLVDLYRPYLPADDQSLGFHHIAIRVDDWGTFAEEVACAKYPVAYASGLEGLEFVYLDARDTLGHYVEYMWATPQWWKVLGYPGA